MSGKEKPVIGYRYHIGMHQVYSLSPSNIPVTALKKLKVGDVEVWSGNVTSNSTITVNAPEAFGGDAKEGGVVGPVDVQFGGASQGVNSYLAAKLTGYPVPSFRGLFALVLNQCQVSAMNPYIKPWSAYLSRINGSFYSAKAAIGDSMNPAHIIYEVLTSHDFGIGIPVADLDLTSFTAAADTLHAEGFGLSIFWEGEETAESFIDYILEHIDGVVFVKPTTGKLTLKLARDDFVVGGLPILDTTNVLEVSNFSQPLLGELTSAVQVKYEDQATGVSGSTTEHDIALIEMQGGYSIAATKDYRGIPNATLASKVALRELRAMSTALIRAELIANREAWSLSVGEPFNLQWSPLGVVELVMRVASIDYGTLTDGRVRIEAVQDVFKAASTIISTPTDTGWVSPISAPVAATRRAVCEVPFYIVMQELMSESITRYNEYDPTSSTVMTLATKPTQDAYNYRIYSSSTGSGYTSNGSGAFCPSALLTAEVGRSATSVLQVGSWVDMDEVTVPTWAYLNGEIVRVTAYTDTTVTVDRGAMDTVPGIHAVGSLLLFGGLGHGIDMREWSSGQTIRAKLCTRTGAGTLLEAAAPFDGITLAARHYAPYPPGNLKLNNVAYPASVSLDITVSWAHRNRLTQTAGIPVQADGSVTSEAEVTYSLFIYNAATAGVLIHVETLMTGASFVYTAAQGAIDNGGTKPTVVRFEIASFRNGQQSARNIVATSWL